MPMKYYDWTTHHAYSQPDKVAIVDLHTGREFSYAALDERAARLADWLQKQGVVKGDRIAVLALNCPEFMELEFACSKIGAVALPVNWRLTVPELEYILCQSRNSRRRANFPYAGVRSRRSPARNRRPIL